MIKIDLVINSNQTSLRFFTDEKSNFVMTCHDTQPMIIMENSSYEFDGICDASGILHFLIQSNDGTLFYIRYDNKTWKKYNLFSSKEKKKSVSDIYLSSNGKTLCAFYIMEHRNKFMLIKHIFSAENLHITPSVIDLVDFRRDFCICTHPDGNTHLYYRDEKGRRQELIFDKNFSVIQSSTLKDNNDTYVMKVSNNGISVVSASICARKNHTALIFKSQDDEKIITFAVAKNAPLSICAKENKIRIFWQEGSFIMYSESRNGGMDFTKPKYCKSETGFLRVRNKGEMPGMYRSDYICIDDFSYQDTRKPLPTRNEYIKKGVSSSLKNDAYHDIDSAEFIKKLSRIEKETEKIGIGIDKICIFLDRLVQFKKDAENHVHSFSPQIKISEKTNIGEKNEDNIKLFENMSIDDAIKDKKQLGAFPGKETENEHTI